MEISHSKKKSAEIPKIDTELTLYFPTNWLTKSENIPSCSVIYLCFSEMFVSMSDSSVNHLNCHLTMAGMSSLAFRVVLGMLYYWNNIELFNIKYTPKVLYYTVVQKYYFIFYLFQT